MALWTGLGQAATVAQLVGADVGGLVSMIVQAALTARQNRSECEQLARRALMIAQLLPHVQEPEAAQPLAGLGDTLRDAHELVVSCQGRSAAYQFVMAGRTAERFRDVQSKIDSYLILFPVISHIGITRRLERLYNVLVPDDSNTVEPSTLPLPQSTEVAQEVPPHGTQEFTLAEILAATNNFSPDTVIDRGGFGNVYRGKLYDGRDVAIKRFDYRLLAYLEEFRTEVDIDKHLEENFRTELNILSSLRHKHIICLLGSCVTVGNDKQRKKKGLLARQRKEPEPLEVPERLIVCEYMENNTLFHHLHIGQESSALSPVTVSSKMRIEVLLGVSHAIEHLQCHVSPPIIHRDIKSSNILFDTSWVPRVWDFGLSLAWDIANEESGLRVSQVIGTFGYVVPEYVIEGRVNLATDLYSLGVVMLEVLTGKSAFSQEGEMLGDLASFAVPIIEAGNTKELLDKRPVPEPTPRQLQALKRAAQIARCCLKLAWEERPVISDVVANLKMVHTLISRDEPGLVDESSFWPFLAKIEESDSGLKFQDWCSVSWAGYQSDLEP